MGLRKMNRDAIVAAAALKMLGYTYDQIARMLHVGKATVYRALENYDEKTIQEAMNLFIQYLNGVNRFSEKVGESENSIAKIENRIEALAKKISEIEAKLQQL